MRATRRSSSSSAASSFVRTASGKRACPASPERSRREPAAAGRRVTLLGWLVTFRHVGTKDYRNMMFLTLEDQRGLYEAVLFPEAYERYGGLVFETRTLRVTGRVEQDGQINCERLEAAK